MYFIYTAHMGDILSVHSVHKMVIYLGTFRHFCGNFKNGIRITETLFMDNFVSRV